MKFDRVALGIVLATTGLKVLLFPSYRSTDFEVHRNWLAITASRPWQEWYSDQASPSPWTLDYPPLFAGMEWALGHIARLFDPAMLDLNNLDYASPATVRFQRLSVIFTEWLLLAAVWGAAAHWPSNSRRRLALFLVAAHPGLIMVDHIHFQYNGVLLGLFLLSIRAASVGREMFAAAAFAALLCAKHIFLYAAPPFFVYLLRFFCRGPGAAARFMALGATVSAVAMVAVGPFLATGQGPQLLRRMFPVSRGLLHAYWAPNVWALYAAADKAAGAFLPKLGLSTWVRPTAAATLTGGIVGKAPFSVLPNVSSGVAALCTLCAMAPGLVVAWRRPSPGSFSRLVAFCTLSAFLFGYHVHEKAILMPLLPMLLSAAGGRDRRAAGEYAFLCTVGTYSLFPLLIRNEEYGVKVLLLVLHLLIALPWLQNPDFWEATFLAKDASGGEEEGEGDEEPSGSSNNSSRSSRSRGARGRGSSNGGSVSGERKEKVQQLFTAWQAAYLWGLVPLELYASWGHTLIAGQRLPFLPLAAVSVYCAAGILYCWASMALHYVKDAGKASPASKRRSPSPDTAKNKDD